MTTVLPTGARLCSLREKLCELGTGTPSEPWFAGAVRNLRGEDGGEHGLLLYSLVRLLPSDRPGAILDIGTARGFSAIAMARAVHDGSLEHRIYTVDVIDHREPRNWHASRKHGPTDPLATSQVSRSEIWSRWYPDEAVHVEPLRASSRDVLENWQHGPILLAFVDGAHSYRAVKDDLALLDRRMAPNGVIVLDDFHPGMILGGIRSRMVNTAFQRIASVVRRWSSRHATLRLGAHNEFLVVSRRFSGIYRAVSEFQHEREDTWKMEIVSMPSRGEYHSADYSLALLTRKG